MLKGKILRFRIKSSKSAFNFEGDFRSIDQVHPTYRVEFTFTWRLEYVKIMLTN